MMHQDQIEAARRHFDQSWMPEPNSGCWLWLAGCSVCSNGRDLRPTLYVGRRVTKAHRFSWKVHRGAIPSGMVVRHKCDVTLCVNPDHLKLGTQADNMRDMVDRGRSLKGERSPRSKLSDEHVVEVFLAAGQHKDIAERYGISLTTVRHIKHRIRRRHLTEGLLNGPPERRY